MRETDEAHTATQTKRERQQQMGEDGDVNIEMKTSAQQILLLTINLQNFKLILGTNSQQCISKLDFSIQNLKTQWKRSADVICLAV